MEGVEEGPRRRGTRRLLQSRTEGRREGEVRTESESLKIREYLRWGRKDRRTKNRTERRLRFESLYRNS